MEYEGIPLNKFIKENLAVDHPLVVAIEQREFVWISNNVIQLLDSICRGIPLGTVILGGGDGLDAEKRMIKKSSDSTIYDGQQRIMSLKKVFADNDFELPKDNNLTGKRCRVWIDILNFKKAIDSNGQVNDCLLRFKNKGAETGCYPFEIVPDDEIKGIDNNEIGEVIRKFVRRKRTFRTASEEWVPLRNVLTLGQKVPEGICEVRDFILRKMNQYKICVCTIGHETETDMGNLFLRINRAGIAVTDDEQYFARLKQNWHDAEQGLKGLHGDGTAFGLLDTVHMMVYMAHNIENQDGISNKREKGVYKRLRLRDFEKSIVSEIQELLKGEKKKKIEDAAKKYTVELAEAGFKYGIHLINKKLVAMAMASAISNLICDCTRSLPDSGAESWMQLARYLFVLDQSGVLSSRKKDRIFREAFGQLWLNPFRKELCSSSVFDDFKERCETNTLKRLMWLAIFQGVPLSQKRVTFDVDHIIPHGWVKSHKNINPDLKQAVDSLGNMWLVGSNTNRKWQQITTPAEKYDAVKKDPNILMGCQLKDVGLSRETFNGLNNAANLKEMQEPVLNAIKSRTSRVKEAVLESLKIK